MLSDLEGKNTLAAWQAKGEAKIELLHQAHMLGTSLKWNQLVSAKMLDSVRCVALHAVDSITRSHCIIFSEAQI